MSWLLAPDCSATAVREPLVDTAKPWKKPGGDVRRADADHLLVRVDLVAAARREARRRGDRVGQRDERDADRGDEQRPDVARRRSTAAPAAGRPCGSAPTVARRRGRTRRSTTVAPTTATSTAGTFAREARAARAARPAWPRPTASAVRVASRRSPSTNARTSSTKPSASVENPQSLGSWPTMIVIAEPVHVADLHLLREQVGDEAELADARARSRSAPTSIASIPASAIAVAGSSPATTSGVIAAKISGDTDESGPSTRTRDGPEERVADEAGDRRVEPGDRREPGQLGVGHALRDEDRREHEAGDEVGAQPRSLVRPGGAHARHPPLETSMLLRDARHRSGPGSAQRDGAGCGTAPSGCGAGSSAAESPRRNRNLRISEAVTMAGPPRCRSAASYRSAPRCRGSAGGTRTRWPR